MSHVPQAFVVISAYNYASYLPACLDAVIAQTERSFSCLVIDDGSTDQTAAVAEGYACRDDRIQVLCKPNEGQLSVFNRAAELCHDDQWVCFLDADDVWSPLYLESVLAAANGSLRRCEFLFTACQTRGPEQLAVSHAGMPARLVDIGITSGLARAFGLWIGNVTSSLSVRGRLLKRLLPYPYFSEWRVRADDCLVLGASIAGARKGWIDQPLVYYRLHDRNHHAGRRMQVDGEPELVLASERFATWLCHRQSLPRVPRPVLVEQELAQLHHWYRPGLTSLRARSALMVREWPLWKRLMVYRRIQTALRMARAAGLPPPPGD